MMNIDIWKIFEFCILFLLCGVFEMEEWMYYVIGLISLIIILFVLKSILVKNVDAKDVGSNRSSGVTKGSPSVNRKKIRKE